MGKFLLFFICFLLFGIGTVFCCTFKGITYQNGDEWIVTNAYVMQCTFDSDSNWEIRLVACAHPNGRRISLGSVYQDSIGEWQCLRRECGTVVSRGPANLRILSSAADRDSDQSEGETCGLSAIRLLNESCGGCNAYKCMDARKARCGADGYLLGFGKTSCERFNLTEIRSLFDNNCQMFIECAGNCLIEQIGHFLYDGDQQQNTGGSSDCDELKNAAFKAHVECFLRCNFCRIWKTNKIALTLAFQEMGEFSTTANEQLKKAVEKCEQFNRTERMILDGKNNLQKEEEKEQKEEEKEQKEEEKEQKEEEKEQKEEEKEQVEEEELISNDY